MGDTVINELHGVTPTFDQSDLLYVARAKSRRIADHHHHISVAFGLHTGGTTLTLALESQSRMEARVAMVACWQTRSYRPGRSAHESEIRS